MSEESETYPLADETTDRYVIEIEPMAVSVFDLTKNRQIGNSFHGPDRLAEALQRAAVLNAPFAGSSS